MPSRPPCTPVGCDVIASLPILGISGWRLAVGNTSTHLCRDTVPTLPMEGISGWEHLKVTRAARGAAPTSRQALPRYSILNTPYSDFTFPPLHRP